mgnify:CR=1 FL=1
MAVASEQEMKAKAQEARAKVIEAEAEVPKAMAEASAAAIWHNGLLPDEKHRGRHFDAREHCQTGNRYIQPAIEQINR